MRAVVFTDGARTIDLHEWPKITVEVGGEILAGRVSQEHCLVMNAEDLLGALLADRVSIMRFGGDFAIAIGSITVELARITEKAEAPRAPILARAIIPARKASTQPPAAESDNYGNIFSEEFNGPEKGEQPAEPVSAGKGVIACIGIPERSKWLEGLPRSDTNVFIMPATNLDANRGVLLDVNRIYPLADLADYEDIVGCRIIHIYGTCDFDMLNPHRDTKIIDHRPADRRSKMPPSLASLYCVAPDGQVEPARAAGAME